MFDFIDITKVIIGFVYVFILISREKSTFEIVNS